MAINGICVLCEQPASVEDKDHGNQKDILCGAGCPRYVVVRSAENRLQGNKNLQNVVLADVRRLAESEKIVVINTDSENSIVCSIYDGKNI